MPLSSWRQRAAAAPSAAVSGRRPPARPASQAPVPPCSPRSPPPHTAAPAAWPGARGRRGRAPRGGGAAPLQGFRPGGGAAADGSTSWCGLQWVVTMTVVACESRRRVVVVGGRAHTRLQEARPPAAEPQPTPPLSARQPAARCRTHLCVSLGAAWRTYQYRHGQRALPAAAQRPLGTAASASSAGLRVWGTRRAAGRRRRLANHGEAACCMLLPSTQQCWRSEGR